MAFITIEKQHGQHPARSETAVICASFLVIIRLTQTQVERKVWELMRSLDPVNSETSKGESTTTYPLHYAVDAEQGFLN